MLRSLGAAVLLDALGLQPSPSTRELVVIIDADTPAAALAEAALLREALLAGLEAT